MSVSQPPSDAPFGLEPNVAAGLAYLLTWVGGIVFLVGGGTNKFVKFAAAQSLVFWIMFCILLYVVVPILAIATHGILGILWLVLMVLGLVVWLWTFISAFQGKEVKIPIVAGITESIFKTMLA